MTTTPTMQSTTVQGVAVHYIEHGRGLPIVILHGAYSDHHETEGALEPFFTTQNGYRRLYFDLPGMGQTPAPDTVNNSDDVINIIEGAIANLIGEKPYLILTHSYGGVMGRVLANRHPDQVQGLALLCPVIVMGEEEPRTIPDQTIVEDSGDWEQSLSAKAAEEFRNYFVIHTPEMVERYQARVVPAAANSNFAALERILGNWQLRKNPEQGKPYPHPTLIATGRHDTIVGYADQWQLVEHYARATFIVVENAGHALPHEQPSLLAALLTDWLARVVHA